MTFIDPKEVITSSRNLDILSRLDGNFQCYAKWFLALSETPHGPLNPFPLSNQVCSWLTRLSIRHEQDKVGNICAHIDAHVLPRSSPVVALQAHLDMIHLGEFNCTGGVDITLDGLRLVAERSTLGADDCFGVALMLEIVERQHEFPHGPLELIMTTDEEIGLYGCRELPRRDGTTDTPIPIFKFKYFVNLDSLTGDRVYVGACGAVRFDVTLKVPFCTSHRGAIEIDLSGLEGGHSGCCIGLNRMNAIRVVARLLQFVVGAGIDFEIAAFAGGELINSIAKSCRATITVDSNWAGEVIEILDSKSKEIFAEYQRGDPNPELIITSSQAASERRCLSVADSKTFLSFVLVLPQGPLRYSPVPAFSGVVDTSANLAILKIVDAGVELVSCCRILEMSKMEEIETIVKSACQLTGWPVAVHKRTIIGFPWSPEPDAALARLMIESYQEVHGVTLGLGLLQCTIETSAFRSLGYEGEMIACCPTIALAHKIGEYLDLDEALRWQDAIHRLLGKLTDRP
jgi:dipeptidase D